MASYVLFFPGATNESPDLLATAGVGAILDKPHWLLGSMNGDTGMFVGFKPIKPQRCKWHAVSADETLGRVPGQVFVGFDKASPLKPSDIARPTLAEGYELALPTCDELHSREQWLIPVADRVPRMAKHDRTGKFYRDPLPEYQLFTSTAQAFVDALKTAAEISWEAAYMLALEAVCINHRITPAILSTLPCWTDEAITDIIRFALRPEDNSRLRIPVC